MKKKELSAQIRKQISKSSRSELRNEAKIPGVFYLRGEEPVSLAVEEGEFNKFIFTAENFIVDLKMDDGREQECVIKDVQFDPITDKVIHFDLMGLVRGQKIKLEVPISLKGTPVGIKSGGRLVSNYHKVEIECLPKHIPDNFELDISGLEIGDSIFMETIKSEDIAIDLPDDTVIVTVTSPKMVEEDLAEGEEGDAALLGEEEIQEPEVIGKGKDKEEETE